MRIQETDKILKEARYARHGAAQHQFQLDSRTAVG